MVVLVTCKNEEDPIKNEGEKMNVPKFELIQAFMYVLVTGKNEEDPIKNEGARVFTSFLPL